ncbi:MAG: hypothetical protein HBSAPP03_24300 [Phycisphaerae bacterium]|nr:MAG: hypothetical protein HBSAPP03_24300 [Phycisphaerae bacterium]
MNAPRNTTMLWASAIALGLLALVQGVRVADWPGEARAEMVARSGVVTVMTADGGNDDVLLVLDERAETVSIYKTDTRNGVQHVQTLSLPTLFTEARARALGRP